ncbi:glycosyltransferase [Synechococcus sp. CBW1107]|uniref:glycosyltransferase n=1 Tax=Synechococcus sp. CBW1107 TaxID=2789857 RepID=UPI002AD32388|nr:glycosyltransferase [Synechococcus sp. CBW1107]CAK6686949.1 Chondroitin synthase [Synechococcus sp. CBW1107]
MQTAFTITLCITSYNNSEDVCRVIYCLKKQQELLAQVLICDDGSTLSHQKNIREALTQHISIPWEYLWHHDRGWRLAEARNLGISKSVGDYIIFIDGDCIPHPKFVKDYAVLAKDKEVLIGQRVHVKNQYRDFPFYATLYDRLLFMSLRRFKKTRNCIRNPLETGSLIGPLASLSSPLDIASLGLGCNHGYWRKDALMIKGYDQLFVSWGPEDSDFVFRLMSVGVRARILKRRCLVYHLDHGIKSNHSRDKRDEKEAYRLMEESYLGQRSIAACSTLTDLVE